MSQLLGVRRASVTECLEVLEREGSIRSSRGLVTIANAQLLQDAACNCFGVIEREYRRPTGGGLVLTKLPPAQASRGSRRRMRAREFSGGIPLEAREQHLGANRAVLERTSQAAAGNGIFVVGDRRPNTCLRDETYAQRRKSRRY